jgi:glycosyltransferase involved in cell wall biosynthesis
MGIRQTSRLPFPVYDYPQSTSFGAEYIEYAWNDFSRGEKGIIMTLDDPSRRGWFANPMGLDPSLTAFLGPGRNYQKWGYFPIDSVGPTYSALPSHLRDTVNNYDRTLAASEFGSAYVPSKDWLPHGIFPVFSPIKNSRELLGWDKSHIWVGCVMANQARKDYPAAFEAISALGKHFGNKLYAWIHTDASIAYWNLLALATDYGVADRVIITHNLTDEQLALHYSACNCTILPTGGEGFGYPIVESMACGTPCITTEYAAGAELVLQDCRVTPIAFGVDTQHNVVRAINGGYQLAYAASTAIYRRLEDPIEVQRLMVAQTEHLQWERLKHSWIKWFKGGI